ncbi:MAG: choice-of-anchor D domain-containing protein, partial [bacterium]
MKYIYGSLFLLLSLFITFPDLATAQQGLPVDGKDFYIGYVYPSFNKNTGSGGRDFHGFFGVYVLVTTYADNDFTISYFDEVTGRESDKTSYHLSARRGISVPLSPSLMQVKDRGDVPEYKSCHITAKKPVNVQYFSTGACSGGSYLAIPTPALGQRYVVPSYFDNPGGGGSGQASQGESSAGFFMLLGAFDGTNVKITPATRTMGGHIGVNGGAGSTGVAGAVSYNVTLNRGQVYLVKGDTSDNSNDISGSILTSNKPVGMLAGHENAFLGEVPPNRLLEGRDFMIEQIIPAEYWDNTGYVNIPLFGTQPVDESSSGYGQHYRVFTDDTSGAKVLESDCTTGLNDMSTSRFAYPTPEKDNIGCPIELHSADGHNFGVMAYQLRDQGTKEPYPAASMMSIVPMSRWRTSFLFYVPANTFEVLQAYFINVIGLRDDIDKWIKFGKDGAGDASLQKITSLGVQGAYTNIPYHPELKGVRLRVTPGSYYITNTRPLDQIPYKNVEIDTMLRGAFMVYHYGMRAVDPDRDLGDFCGDDFFFSYALPIGMTVSAGIGHPVVTVDTFCSHWHVCVHDNVPISSATLIDDKSGDVYGKPGKVYYNAGFDEASDPDRKKEIVFNGTDTAVCFDVLVSNAFDSAYAPIFIVDKKGFHLVPILELRYQAPSVKLSVLPTLPPKLDTLVFPPMLVHTEACSTLVYINTSQKGAFPFHILSAKMQKDTLGFKISSTDPQLPATLKGGDTLKITVCFDPKDTLRKIDSVIVTTDCAPTPLEVRGQGATPLIYATDYDFGNVAVGTSKCAQVYVSNRGKFPFTLTKNWLLHNSVEFSMDPNSAASLPRILKPGEQIALTFCYSPTKQGPQDSTTVDWDTDIPTEYKDQYKNWSFLKGSPIKPGLVWDRPTQFDSVICEDSIIVRAYLINNGNATANNVNVFMTGLDKDEYTIVANQRGYTVLSNFNINARDSMWVDVLFKPDLTKAYRLRNMNLVATYSNAVSGESDSTVLAFTAKVLHAVLAYNPPLYDFGFITRGVQSTGYVQVTNTGDAPFVLSSLNMPNPPVDSIFYNGKQLGAGDTIPVGGMVTLTITTHLDTYTDTTVTYQLNSDHACGNYPATLHAAASSLKVQGTGYPSPNVFVGCRQHDSTVTFTNKGSFSVTLVSVDISASNPPGQFDLVDSKGVHGTSVTLNSPLNFNQSVTVPITYHPTVAGPATATITYHYDSANTHFMVTAQATGIGVQLKTTLSAAKAGGQPYTGDTKANFNAQLSLADSVIPPAADVKRVTFRLTYKRDVINYVGAGPAGGYTFPTGNPPTEVAGANGDAYLDFNVAAAGTGVITNLEDIVTVTYLPMVAIDKATNLTISDVKFFDSKDNAICYVVADTIPGQFIPGYLCGDSTLRKFLNNILPTRISQLSPSVVGEDQTPILYYQLNRADVPVKVEIYNVLGELVRTVKNTAGQPVGDYKLPIGVQDLQTGSYIVRLITPV